ncbi:MAG: EF-P beta-lysylation protein EpmB, partial [Acidobacteria bacterium]|nr:EF-P beta-lysylation protein EpmB [Acidobacteriota bacterium]
MPDRRPMIARTLPSWQRSLATAVSDPFRLLELLDLPVGLLGDRVRAEEARAHFPLRVPLAFVRRMRPGDPDDPLLRQVLPLDRETEPAPGFVTDPLAESVALPVPGLLHKYRGRALMVVTGACGVHCRYCFRRHFPYGEASPGRSAWDGALSYLAEDPAIEEVILSGGDPLAVSDGLLAELAARLEAIPHLKRLRVHTRMPVVLPERVDEALLGWLDACRLRPVLVIHTNHPREIDDDVVAAMARLSGAGVLLLNQAVLLRGVNDREDTLRELSERCFEAGVLPYYLHL